jgi:HlyD family secretion protein
MKLLFKLVVLFAVLGGLGFAAKAPVEKYLRERNRPDFREVEVDKGEVTWVVNSTGEIKPVLSVKVGTFVSGPIKELNVDFNDRVTEGQLLARIDSRIYDASVAADEAALATREAEFVRVTAELQRSINDEKRAEALREEDPDYISQSEIDRYRFSRMSLDAQLLVARAMIDQAEANLKNSQANLDYTKIVSPVDGIVIDRKIDPGQTLAASFQTPELFIIAPEMEKKMHIFAAVDEADIGKIKEAQKEARPVKFTVDAYPDDLYEGLIEQVRLSSTAVSNVVTYPVVVATPNPDLKLMPGMTASLSFVVEQKQDVIRIPNSALRYFPDKKHVRENDQPILEGLDPNDEEDDNAVDDASASERAAAADQRNRRHVWVKDDDKLRAVEVFTGISDNKFTELVSGDLKPGDKLVFGVRRKS